MSKRTLLLFGFLATTSVLSAQKLEFEYIAPPAVQGSNYKMEVSDAVSKGDYNKLKLTIENTSKSHYYRLNMEKTGFNIAGLGTYYSKRGKDLLVGPGDKRSAVAEVTGNEAYVVPSYELQINGLSSGQIPDVALPVADFQVEVGKSNSNAQNGFSISTVKVEQSKKKDKVTAQIKVMFDGQDNEMGLVDLSRAVILDKNGVRVGEFDIKPNKIQEMLSGDDFKININITSMETSFTLSWVNAFKLVNFSPESVAPLTIKSSNVTTTTTGNTTTSTTTTANSSTTTTVVNTNCSAYQENKGGKVKVNFHNSEGECFTLMVNGIMLPQETANATMYLDYGKKNVTVKFSSGTMLVETITIFDTWESCVFRIKKNPRGEYVMNNDLTGLVLNEKGKALGETTNANASAHNKTNNTSTFGSSSSSNNSQPEREFSSGSTTVKLKITYKGTPASDTYITIKHGNTFVGNNKTDSWGNVTIKTNSLASRSIDVYGEKGSYNWNVRGAIALDDNLSANVDLYEIAKFIAEMMGGNADDIGRGWGF